jgi:chromosome segregation ATPase
MDGDYISRHEHEEFRRSMEAENQRLEDENKRQNHRLEALEETVKQVAAISTSVEKLALNMENMLKEQVNQGKRLETLEGRDGEMWRKVVGYVATAIAGIVVGYIFKQLGM